MRRLYDKAYGIDSYRRKIPHIPFGIDRDIVNKMQEKFSPYFEKTSANRFRQPDDMMLTFSLTYFIISENKWPYEVEYRDKSSSFVSIRGDPKFLEENLKKLTKSRKKFACFNDDIDYEKQEQAKLLESVLFKFFQNFYPHKSVFEKN